MQTLNELKVKVLKGRVPYWSGCEIEQIDFTSADDEGMISIKLVGGNDEDIRVDMDEIKLV